MRVSGQRRGPVKRPEEDLQKIVVRYLRLACPDAVFFAVPNQKGTRKTWEQGLLKGLGVRPGVADLVFVLPGGPYLICRSLAEVDGALAAWGVPMRGRSWE